MVLSDYQSLAKMQNTIEPFITFGAAMLSGMGAVFTALRLKDYAGKALDSRKILQREVFNGLTDRFKDDKEFLAFLYNIEKENGIKATFGLSIPTAQIGSLMFLYNKGLITRSEIKKAWYYRKELNSITFELNKSQKFSLFLGNLLSSAFLVLGSFLGFSGIAGNAFGHTEYSELTYLAVLFMFLAFMFLLMSDDLRTAERLQKRLIG